VRALPRSVAWLAKQKQTGSWPLGSRIIGAQRSFIIYTVRGERKWVPPKVSFHKHTPGISPPAATTAVWNAILVGAHLIKSLIWASCTHWITHSLTTWNPRQGVISKNIYRVSKSKIASLTFLYKHINTVLVGFFKCLKTIMFLFYLSTCKENFAELLLQMFRV